MARTALETTQSITQVIRCSAFKIGGDFRLTRRVETKTSSVFTAQPVSKTGFGSSLTLVLRMNTIMSSKVKNVQHVEVNSVVNLLRRRSIFCRGMGNMGNTRWYSKDLWFGESVVKNTQKTEFYCGMRYKSVLIYGAVRVL